MSGTKAITNNWRRLKLCLTVAIVAIYTLLAAYVCILFIHFSLILVELPPDKGIHHQTYSQQTKEIENSNLGVTGGLPLLKSNNQGEEDKEESGSSKNALEYLSSARDLAAQEGVWRASNVIAILGFIQVLIGFMGLILIANTLKETRKASYAARKTIAEAARSADAAEKAQKAHVLPIMIAKFGTIESQGTSSFSAHGRLDKSKVIVNICVGNFGNTPVRGGRIDCGQIINGNNKQVRYPFKALAAGETINDTAEIELYVSELIGGKTRTTYEIFTSTVFTDVDGDKSPILIAWGDIRLMRDGLPVSYDQLRKMSVPERLNSYDNVRVEVTYVDLPDKQKTQQSSSQNGQ